MMKYWHLPFSIRLIIITLMMIKLGAFNLKMLSANNLRVLWGFSSMTDDFHLLGFVMSKSQYLRIVCIKSLFYIS